MDSTTVLLLDQIQDDTAGKLKQLVPEYDFIDAREPAERDKHLPKANILYGFLPLEKYPEALQLQWVQLASAGVSRRLCAIAKDRGFLVTNLAGLYGPSIAEHTLTVMSMLSRNLHTALRNQTGCYWDNSIAKTMSNLSRKTLALVGLGDIGRAVARLAQSFGMQVLGTRRHPQPTSYVDHVFPVSELHNMLPEADFVVVTVPLTPETETLLGEAELALMKPGVFLVNVSRGAVVDEGALLKFLQTGHIAGAALDVFTQEPLPANHPFWTLPQVIISPHYCGDTVNNSSLPLERFTRNLRAWQKGEPFEHIVNLDLGY